MLVSDLSIKLKVPEVFWPDATPPNHYCRFYDLGDIYCEFHKILSHTPKGVWVEGFVGGKPKFICNNWKKRFAHATPEEAFEAFKHRKRKQIQILQGQLEAVTEALKTAEAFTPPTTKKGNL